MGGTRKQKRKVGKKTFQVDLAEFEKIVAVSKERALDEAEHKVLENCQDLLTELLIRQPRNNEKSKNVLGDQDAQACEAEAGGESPDKKTRKGGKGRNPRDAYSAAKDIELAHPELKPGDFCPCGCGYRLYLMERRDVFRYFTGQVPIHVTFYYRQKLHSSGCDTTYTAPLPEDVGPRHYAPTAITMFILMRYAFGLPMYRNSMMLGYLGVPIAVSTQYEQMAETVEDFKPIHKEMIYQAAQGKQVFLDDTTGKILKFQRAAGDEKRTGIFTTGIISVHETVQIALFFTGRNHAGENMQEVLKQRGPDLPALLQMSDALSRNFSELEPGQVIQCSCMTHGRRNFVEIVNSFPEDCRRVIEAIGRVYAIDQKARDELLSPEQRFLLHQEQSKSVMDDLKKWMDEQLAQKKVEANSPLGQAIRYMQNHWEKLTAFLRVAGAALDNNIVERALKKVVLHRKNSLFYRTAKGALVGDIYMSLIQTCQMNKVDPFDYLTKVQLNAAAAKEKPAEWLPWTYRATLEAKELEKIGTAA